MSWADKHIKTLKEKSAVEFRPTGGSMKGLIESGDICRVVPVDGEVTLKIGSIVLCRVKNAVYLHKIIAIKEDPEVPKCYWYEIGNNKGGVNGWITRKGIYGLVTTINGRLR